MNKIARALISRASVFPPGGHDKFVIDNVKLVLSLKRPDRLRARRPKTLDLPTLQDLIGLKKTNQLKLSPVGGQLAAIWREGDLVVQQALGAVNGRSGHLSQTLDWNPLRAVREKLSIPAGGRRSQEEPDNYLDPQLVSQEEAHNLVLDELCSFVKVRLPAYLDLVNRLFCLSLAADEVQASVNMIELAWDRSCPVATLIRPIWFPAWPAEMDRPSFLWPTQPGSQTSGVLKSQGTKAILKLYAKTNNLLRFEAQMTKDHLKALIGHPVNLLDRDVIEQDLNAAAKPLYDLLLTLQSSIAFSGPPLLIEFLSELFPKRQQATARLVLTSLIADRRVTSSASDQPRYRVLRRLRQAGLVRRAERGAWTATIKLLPTLRQLERILQFSP